MDRNTHCRMSGTDRHLPLKSGNELVPEKAIP